jgi:hypothetical protein
MLVVALKETYAPPDPSTNDGVVVAGEPSSLDFGFEFHTILLCVGMFDSFGV